MDTELDTHPPTNLLTNNPPTPTNQRWLMRLSGFALISLALLLLYYGLIMFTAYQSGEQLRVERQEEARIAELAKQLSLATADLGEERYELAIRRLEWVLAQDPEYPEAKPLYVAATHGRDTNSLLSATPSPTPSPTPAANDVAAVPNETNGLDEAEDTASAAEEIARLQQLAEERAWEQLLEEVPLFQAAYPNTASREVIQILYDAHIAHGRVLLYSDQLERALFHFAQAKRLGDLPELVQGEIVFAEMYLEGISFYRANWDAYFYYFRELCTYTPTFQNSCDRLVKGLTEYADLLYFQGDFCPAFSYYQEAATWRGNRGDGLGDKINNANTNCLSATPTPDPGAIITGTAELELTDPDQGAPFSPPSPPEEQWWVTPIPPQEP